MKKNKDSIPFDLLTIDLGGRKQTGYCANGIIVEIGDGFANNQVKPIALQIDNLESVIAKKKNEQKAMNLESKEQLKAVSKRQLKKIKKSRENRRAC